MDRPANPLIDTPPSPPQPHRSASTPQPSHPSTSKTSSNLKRNRTSSWIPSLPGLSLASTLVPGRKVGGLIDQGGDAEIGAPVSSAGSSSSPSKDLLSSIQFSQSLLGVEIPSNKSKPTRSASTSSTIKGKSPLVLRQRKSSTLVPPKVSIISTDEMEVDGYTVGDHVSPGEGQASPSSGPTAGPSRSTSLPLPTSSPSPYPHPQSHPRPYQLPSQGSKSPPHTITLPTPSQQSLLLSLKRQDQLLGIDSISSGMSEGMERRRKGQDKAGGGAGNEGDGVKDMGGDDESEKGADDEDVDMDEDINDDNTLSQDNNAQMGEADNVDAEDSAISRNGPSSSIQGYTIPPDSQSSVPHAPQSTSTDTSRQIQKQSNQSNGMIGSEKTGNGKLGWLGNTIYGYAFGSGGGTGEGSGTDGWKIRGDQQDIGNDTADVKIDVPETAVDESSSKPDDQAATPPSAIPPALLSTATSDAGQSPTLVPSDDGVTRPADGWWGYVPVYGRKRSQLGPPAGQVCSTDRNDNLANQVKTDSVESKSDAKETTSTAPDARKKDAVTSLMLTQVTADAHDQHHGNPSASASPPSSYWMRWGGPVKEDTAPAGDANPVEPAVGSTDGRQGGLPTDVDSSRMSIDEPQQSTSRRSSAGEPILRIPTTAATASTTTQASRTARLLSYASQAAHRTMSNVSLPGLITPSPSSAQEPTFAPGPSSVVASSTAHPPFLTPAGNSVLPPVLSASPGSKSVFGTGKNRSSVIASSPRPNRLVPTMSEIFDRPPRLAPSPPTQLETKEPTAEEKKAETSKAAGKKAWKAWGSMGQMLRSPLEESPPLVSTESIQSPHSTAQDQEPPIHNPHLPRMVLKGKESWIDVRRIVVVGIHGWFPQISAARSVLGDPRKSAYYASMMGSVVSSLYEDDHGIGEQDLEKITYVHLDGDGTIETRVKMLYEQFLSKPEWMIDLKKADAVFFVGHSQGCIVAVHIMAKMIADGHLLPRLTSVIPTHPRRSDSDPPKTAKIGFLAICGVHLGPLYYPGLTAVMQPYLWLENAAARELFAFQDPSSAVSAAYQVAMASVMSHGVNVVLLASLDDQVVPIYGALFSNASHPNLLRVLHVDGSAQLDSDFMIHLLTFCMSLRNAGIDDQGLLEHLSEAVAGAWRGVGHSSPGEDPAGYELLVRYVLGTDSPPLPAEGLSIAPFSVRDRNDYELPWTLRGVMDDPEIGKLFEEDIKQLKGTILDWQPVTKALTQIKRRLEPMAGRRRR